MSKIETTFGKPKVFLPVIHPNLGEEAVMSSVTNLVSWARSEPDGVFLINQGMDARALLNLAPKIKDKYPNLWIGINLLGFEPEEVIKKVSKMPEIGGVWSDDCGVDGRKPYEITACDTIYEVKQETGWKGLYFGGTAFKTQQDIPLEKVGPTARMAEMIADVVTTSGRGTGIAADFSKVRRMKEWLWRAQLGLASGVTPENVDAYLPYVDAFLVATGIEKSVGKIDNLKASELGMKIHSFDFQLISKSKPPQTPA